METLSLDWEKLSEAVVVRHPGIVRGKMFGLDCLKRPDGKVAVILWTDGGITVKLENEAHLAEALAVPGAGPAAHAFSPNRPMRRWVHVPSSQRSTWLHLVDYALA